MLTKEQAIDDIIRGFSLQDKLTFIFDNADRAKDEDKGSIESWKARVAMWKMQYIGSFIGTGEERTVDRVFAYLQTQPAASSATSKGE